MTMRSLAFTVFLLLFAVPGAYAQDTDVPQARARGEGTYAHLFTFEFRPGKTDEGVRILRDALIPSWRTAGVEITLIESLIGKKNVFLIIPLLEGPRYFEWEIPAQDARAWAALVDQVGPEEAGRVVDRFVGLLDSQSQDFVFLPARAEG